MKKHKLENKGGITLIALAVKIVILLILSGVSINLILGNNGIISKAKDALSETKTTAMDEQIKMAYQNYVIGLQAKTDSDKNEIFNNDFLKYLPDGSRAVLNDDGSIIAIINNTMFNIDNENRIIRGGSAGTYAYQGTPQSRNGYYIKEKSTIKGNKSNWHAGFRTVLYLK